MIIYFIFIFLIIIGNKIKINKLEALDGPSISVIVAIRNGENSLKNLISDLSLQNYKSNVEFILVDDNSNDKTSQIINNICKKDTRFIHEKSINGNSLLFMKKRALDAGIRKAKNEWLLFTDVDCRLNNNWIASMSELFVEKNDYIIGRSNVKIGNSFLNIFQYIDFFMLLNAARGVVKLGYPLACTGQNQAYRKSLYNKVDGFTKISNERQGDDTLFLQICKRWGRAKVVFADNPSSFVLSRKEKSWISFLKQRIRWAGDANVMWKYNFIFYMLMLSCFIFHMILLILITSSIFSYNYITIIIKCMIIKFILEFSLFYSVNYNINQYKSIIYFIFWYLMYIPYFILVGLGSFFHKNIVWKGRKLKSVI